MVWDGTTMYGVSTSITQSQIFSINMTTGACTPIGAASAVCAGAIELFGRPGAQYSLFATDIVADNLYKFNKTTGVATLVGPLGQNLNFGQGGTVDPNDNTFYTCCYATGPQLRKIDTATGTLGPILCTYTAQATGLAAMGSAPPPSPNRMLTLPTPGVNTNYVSIPHQAGMIGFTNLTIEAWVRPGSITTAATVLNKGAASFDYQLGISATTMIPFVRLQGVVATATSFIVTPLIWTHIAATFDGTNVRFYKDGALVSTVPLSGTPGSSSNEMRIGRGNSDAGNGNIEELRLWSVARTQGAIDSNKCRKYPSQFNNSTGLKSIWHFDNNYNDSVSGFNGSPFGNVSFDTVSFPIPGANCNLVGIEPVGNIIPKVYSLEQNYPNPFNPTTNIQFSIPKGGFVELKVYDLLGREISNLVSDPFEAGIYSVSFDASKLSSGVYFYTLKVNDFTSSKKMLLVK